MKRFDMHIHAANAPADPEKLLARMEQAGIYGGCIFSNRPYLEKGGTSFDERLTEVFDWTRGYEDRLFPIMRIHPFEDGIIENIHKAVELGIKGFKIICNDFFVYEDRSMKVLAEIASLDKPLFFHTGILWSGTPNSRYSQPLTFEALLDIPGLRFSMGHCSWPWHDDCLALYGKFLHALTEDPARSEMFFDITPGTPLIYREELLTKLYTIGYDVPDNIMFGTDGTAHTYDPRWTKQWLDKDAEIFDRLGVTDELKQKLYHDNVLRFLGLKEKDFEHVSPACDGFVSWKPGVSRDDCR